MDNPIIIVDVLSRWLHIGTAIVLLGGSVFLRFVLMPAADVLSESEHEKLKEPLMARWKRVVHTGVALLLLSGFYNYARAIPKHDGDKLYHPVLGTKILLAFGVFFLASVLVGKSPKFEGLRQNRAKWLSVLILLTSLVVALGGLAKVAAPGSAAKDAKENTAEE